MSKLNLVRRCYSCGAILQDGDPAAPGYISPEVLLKQDALVLFCNHCYEQQKYNLLDHDLTCSPDYLTMMQDAAATDALVVCIVDLFSFELAFPSDCMNIIKDNRLLVIANKRDLLPKNIDEDTLREYVAHRFRMARVKVNKEDVFLASINSLDHDRSLWKEIDQRRQRHDVYAIGASGAGKTMLLSAFLRSYKNKTPKSVVTENYPGTNLAVMQIPLDSSSWIYDTPGTPLTNSITYHLPVSVAKLCVPSEVIKPRSYSLMAGDEFFLGGLARIALKEGRRTEITYFGAKTIRPVRVRNKDPEATFLRGIRSGDLVPASPALCHPNHFAVYDIEVEETGDRDIGIAGFGWIRFRGDGQTFRIYVPKSVGVYTSRSKIPNSK